MKCPKVKRVLNWSWDGVPNSPPRGRCCAPLKPEACKFRNPSKRNPELDPNLCNHYSKYTVNGKHYCRKHASLKCLDLCDPILAGMPPAQRKFMEKQ